MENGSRRIDSTWRGTARSSSCPADAAGLARAAGEELLLMGMPQLNILLVGRNDAVQLVLRTLLGQVRKPVTIWSSGEPFVLPAIEHPGTLVLREVRALSVQQQARLLEWSNDGRRNPQVISTTSTPLLPLVSAGTFNDTLYYRLNTVFIDLTPSDRSDRRN